MYEINTPNKNITRVVLTRKVGESLLMKLPDGSEILVTVTRQRACGVSMAITCAREILIHRGEHVGVEKADHEVLWAKRNKPMDRKIIFNPLRCLKCQSLDVYLHQDGGKRTRRCKACGNTWEPHEEKTEVVK